MEDVILGIFGGFILGWIIGRVHLRVSMLFGEKFPHLVKKKKKEKDEL